MPQESVIADLGAVVKTKSGEFMYQCHIEKPDGTQCGTLIKNEKHNIGSHRKMHNPDSKYAADQAAFAQPIMCRETVHDDDGTAKDCGFSMRSKHLMLAHYRRDHGLKGTGEAAKLYGKYGV
ncbi:hypothetical protein DL769_006870 [Monosporascus sp. CRB-8-3]|nr:hypothetical protein DL769_006870 [Monosporascus sp. CRB-8-3]